MKHRIYTNVLHLTLCIALVLSFIPMTGAAVNAEDKLQEIFISSEQDWDDFGDAVKNGDTFSDKKVVLANDISVHTMIGTKEYRFKGVFQGNGHTITVDYTVDEDAVAPFRYVDGAKFYNVKVSGTINTSKMFAGGLISSSVGNTIIDCCYSNVHIYSSVDGDGTHGGFIAHLEGKEKSVIIKDSLFDGTISGKSTIGCGGFVGWPVFSKVEFRNCLNNGVFETASDGYGCGTFSRVNPDSKEKVTINNCYYKTAYGEVQGEPIGDMTPDELKEALKKNNPDKNFWIVSGGKVVPASFKASATVTKAPVPAAKKMTANGKTRNLVKKGEAAGGKLMYALGKDAKTVPEDGWNENIPTGKKAGTYYVWYMVAADEFHLNTEPACVTVKITKPVRKVDRATKSLIKSKDKKALIKKMEDLEKAEEQQAENPGSTDGKPAGIGTMLREQIRNVSSTLSNLVKGIFRR